MLDTILANAVKKFVYPERDMTVEKHGGMTILRVHDMVGCNDYLLDGTYSYDEVLKLNELTTYSAGFGFCSELGPVAFIGIPNPNCAQRSGYFKYKVHAYGTPFDESEIYFKADTEEDAKQIVNYSVYGMYGIKKVAKVAPISQLGYVYDSRYHAKTVSKPKVFDMDCKLKGVFSYNQAKLLATGSLKEKDGYSGGDHPILFATLENGQHVGIINMWSSDVKLVRGFRDVWEFGAEEPKIQEISFLNKQEASKIEDYELYVYNYASSGIGKDKYRIQKYDRTLDKRFQFHLPDGSDYRLVEHTELFR